MKQLNLSWAQRLTLINHYKPTDDQIKKTLNISQDDLECAKDCLSSGMIKLDSNMDPVEYGNIFTDNNVVISKSTFASKPTKEPKKRGRKGDRIQIAFESITSEPVLVTEFMEKHGISLPVLRQAKRFDKTGLPGTVNVKKISIDGQVEKQLMVWRSVV